VDRIVESPTSLMTGGQSCYFDLDESRQGSIPPGGGPLDAPEHLPSGGAWNFAAHGIPLVYFSVPRPGYPA
jgi:hypothetical protein